MTNRITERTILTALQAFITEGIPASASTAAIPQEEVENWIARRIAALDKKKASGGLSEKEKAAREVENSAVLAVLATFNEGVTPSKIGLSMSPVATPQKVTGILHRLESLGQVKSLVSKGVTYWMRVEG